MMGNYEYNYLAGPNKGNYKPDEPENHRKERKEGRGREREKKRLATVFSFYSERQKTSAEGHSQTLTQSDLVFINPGIYKPLQIERCLERTISGEK